MTAKKDYNKVLNEYREFVEKNSKEFNDALERIKTSQTKVKNII